MNILLENVCKDKWQTDRANISVENLFNSIKEAV